jgi:type II secretory pathway component PulF
VNGGQSRAITLEQLISLNDEISALVRAGVPLEKGLVEVARDLAGRPGKLADLLGRRMSAGESLGQILASQPGQFPPVWLAVVEAGLRSGQLAAALESMSTTTRRVAELRKTVGAALLYPLVVLAVAYAIFVFLVTRLSPVTSRAYEDLTRTSEPILSGLTWLGQTAVWWAIWLPLAVALLLGAWWHRSSRADWSRDSGRHARWWHRWTAPGRAIGRPLRDGRMAAFAEILALLVQQRVPLQQAIVLAGDASGDRALAEASRQIAEGLQRGEVPARRADLPRLFPPLLGWLLVTGRQQPQLREALSRAAARYREHAARSATWTAVYLPIILTVVLGGAATLLVALVTLVPFWRLLYTLTQPHIA